VAQWLQTQNWLILHHRWRCRWGEIDLIAQQAEWGTGEQLKQEHSLPNLKTQQQPNSLRNTSGNTNPASSLVFVEVKTRSSGNWDADGRLAITLQKQAKLWHTAQLFLAEHPDLAHLPCRFDVALVSYQRSSQRSRRVSQTSLSPHSTDPSSLPVAIDKGNGRPVPSIQLAQPLFTAGYRLILQDYIPSAFDGLD
jgi:putative endonuclease